MPCDHCPLDDPASCKSYPALCENMAKNPKRWRPVLDRVNAHLEPTKATTVVGMAVESIVDIVASGFAASGKDEAERRLAVCRECPSNLYDAKTDRCLECRCVMALKTHRLAASCPRAHW